MDIETEKPTQNPSEFQAHYVGRGSELFFLMLKNIVFTVLTIGIYHFWAKTHLRRYHWSHTQVDGHRLYYTGQGKELLLGFIKAVVLYALFSGVGYYVSSLNNSGIVYLWLVMAGLLFSGLYPIVIYFARRYRLTRTHYRNIRFNMNGKVGRLMRESFADLFLTALTLGLYFGVYQNNLHRRLVNMSQYGSLKMRYSGPNLEAFMIFFKALIFTPLTLGLYLPFYKAELIRFRTNHTKIGDLQCHSNLAGTQLLGIFVLGIFAIPLSFGLATPWVLVARYNALIDSVYMTGFIDFDLVQQSTTQQNALGEEFGELFSIDAAF